VGVSLVPPEKQPRTKDDDEDEEDWDMTLNTYKAWAMLSFLALRALEFGLSENYSGREVRRDALPTAADEPAV
jgi:hypothetical protein